MDSASANAANVPRGSSRRAKPSIAQRVSCKKSKKTAAYSISVVCRKIRFFQSTISIVSMTTGSAGTSSYHPTRDVRTFEIAIATSSLALSVNLPKAA